MVEVHGHRRGACGTRAGQDNLLPMVLAGSWEIPNNLHSNNYYFRSCQSFFARLISPLAFVDFRRVCSAVVRQWSPGGASDRKLGRFRFDRSSHWRWWCGSRGSIIKMADVYQYQR